jgi:hypothetical protein
MFVTVPDSLRLLPHAGRPYRCIRADAGQPGWRVGPRRSPHLNGFSRIEVSKYEQHNVRT